jgi:hypothetical protein
VTRLTSASHWTTGGHWSTTMAPNTRCRLASSHSSFSSLSNSTRWLPTVRSARFSMRTKVKVTFAASFAVPVASSKSAQDTATCYPTSSPRTRTSRRPTGRRWRPTLLYRALGLSLRQPSIDTSGYRGWWSETCPCRRWMTPSQGPCPAESLSHPRR